MVFGIIADDTCPGRQVMSIDTVSTHGLSTLTMHKNSNDDDSVCQIIVWEQIRFRIDQSYITVHTGCV